MRAQRLIESRSRISGMAVQLDTNADEGDEAGKLAHEIGPSLGRDSGQPAKSTNSPLQSFPMPFALAAPAPLSHLRKDADCLRGAEYNGRA